MAGATGDMARSLSPPREDDAEAYDEISDGEVDRSPELDLLRLAPTLEGSGV